ncbi:MAG TPA: N-acetyl-alpha-D-glucosaminyl L-malate synthase BshA [Dongiaceae bacterium]|nr:N-acetyl-alpha-D-glucosaminyl L-malate synthase BshA [Dongiaceae bacterium]
MRLGITCYPSVGGSGVLASQLGQQLARRGHEVHFISYGRPFRLDTSQPNVFFHPVTINEYDLFRYPDYTLPLSVKLAEVSRERGLELLHAHYAVPHAVAACLAQEMLGASAPRLITTLHGTDTTLIGKDPNYRPIIKHALERSAGVTAVSEFLKRETLEVFGGPQGIKVVHNFFAPVEPSRPRAAMRTALGFKDDDVVVLHMSNLRPGKRIPDLLRVIAAAKRRDRIKLLLLAGGDFAPHRPLADSLGLGDRLTIVPAVVDVENYLAAADVGLYTSDFESFGLSILESMFHGHPVLATDSGGVPEVVVDGETGYLVPVGDINGFAARLDELASDPAHARALGVRGAERARRLFSADTIVGDYLEFYRQVLAKQAPTGQVPGGQLPANQVPAKEDRRA